MPADYAVTFEISIPGVAVRTLTRTIPAAANLEEAIARAKTDLVIIVLTKVEKVVP